MQRLDHVPPGVLVKEVKNQVTVTLPRPPKEHHWRVWLIIVAMGLLGTEYGLSHVIGYVVVCVVLYFYWWRARW